MCVCTTCATLYCLFCRVLLSVCRSPFIKRVLNALYRRRVSDETFPHFSISLLSGLDSSERERERNDREDVLVCPTLGFRFVEIVDK